MGVDKGNAHSCNKRRAQGVKSFNKEGYNRCAEWKS
jgi:hypothetical protein